MPKLNITSAEYHAHPALGSSGIRLLRQRPSLFKCRVLDGVTEQKRCFDLGTAFHAAVLEPDAFATNYTLSDLDKRTKEYKAFATDNAGKNILNANDYAIVTGMRDGVMRNATAAKLFAKSPEVEMSYFWNDKITNVECKCRPDALLENKDRLIAIDLKSTRDASARAFQKSVAQYGYHIQAAWYSHGIEVVGGRAVDLFLFIAVEPEPPFDCGVYYLSEDALDIGWRDCQNATKVFAECKKSNLWPGLPPGLTELPLPEWYNIEE